jgi:hypothetical protein
MPEQDFDYSASTDTAASTAEFRAFAERAGEGDRPWSMRAPGRRVLLLAVVCLAVAAILAIIGLAVTGF